MKKGNLISGMPVSEKMENPTGREAFKLFSVSDEGSIKN
jgi:hypothetical protein